MHALVYFESLFKLFLDLVQTIFLVLLSDSIEWYEKAQIEHCEMKTQSCSDVQSLYNTYSIKDNLFNAANRCFSFRNTNLVCFVNPLKHFDGLTNVTSSLPVFCF